MYVSGRLFPVKVYNTIEPQSDYLDAALVTIFQIHMRRPKGDILVFLTGMEWAVYMITMCGSCAVTEPP